MNQEGLRNRLFIELDCVTLDARQVAGDLTSDQLAWRPPGGGWGVGHLLEHLVVSHDAYLNRMRGLIYARDAAHQVDGQAEWEPSLAGWLLVSSMRSARKQLSARVYGVANGPREQVLDAFLDRQSTLVTFLRAASALDWTRVRLSSPTARWIRLNLGDAFMVMVVHAQRHIRQMERVRDLPDFPV